MFSTLSWAWSHGWINTKKILAQGQECSSVIERLLNGSVCKALGLNLSIENFFFSTRALSSEPHTC
jgi:hypothetical protein